MTLPGFALKNRYTIYALAIGSIVFGLSAYFSLPIQLLPETAPPLVNVLTQYPGAVAQDVADLVSEPIEEETASLEGVYKVTSVSQNGLSLVSIEFRYDVSVDLAAVDVQNGLSKIRARLPREIGEPQVMKFSTSNRPVLTVGLRGEDMVAVRRLAEDVIAPDLQRLAGVAIVDVFGGYRPEISVHVDRHRLEAHSLRLDAVVAAIRSHNISAPAGQIRANGREYAFRVDEQSRTPQDIENIPIALKDGSRVRVGDLAEVTEGSGEDLSRFRVNGEPTIGLQILRQDDANTVEVVELARARIAELAALYPFVEMVEAEEAATFTQQVVNNMLGSVWQALLLATVVIFLFLGSLRRGIVVIISLPMSFLLTFLGMKLFGIEVNMVTLTAIVLSVGMVVDASVVVLENITRRFSQGGISAQEAALVGASEIQFAVMAGVATTLVVLIPLLFLYGFVGKIFGPLATTLVIAFLSSLLVALALVPILAARITGEGGRGEQWAGKISRPWNWLMGHVRDLYVGLLKRSLHHRKLVFLIAIGLLVAGLITLRSRGSELLPKMDSGSSFVVVETPSGSSLEETERVVKEIEQVILQEPELVLLSSQIGFEPGMHSLSGGGVQGVTQGYMSITLTPRTARQETIWEIQNRLRRKISKIPNIRNFVVRESGSTAKATTASSIIVGIRGEDPLVLDKLGDEVLATLKSVEGVVTPYRGWRLDQRSILLDIDAERARELGIPPALAARELAQALDGVSAGIMRGALGEDTPILVRYDERFRRQERDALDVRTLSARDGKPVPLGAIARSRETIIQGLVTRENLQPKLEILALHQGRPLSFVVADVRRALSTIVPPQGYQVGLDGETKDTAEARGELARALVLALLAIYLLLVAQFRSFIHPITVLMSVPLSLIGVGIGLWIGGKPVSMPVMVGLILLVGIVVNNSIILIDFIRQRREEGKQREAAIVESVATRFRPIMMTSFSTIVGMLPLALEWALGAERFSPLAMAVIGGMTASTFLTMIVIPVFYDAFDAWGERLRPGGR